MAGKVTLFENNYLYIVTIEDAVYEKHKKEINHFAYDINCNYELEKSFACFSSKFVFKWYKPLALNICTTTYI